LRDVLIPSASGALKSPEASGDRRYPWGTYTLQAGWTNPLTNQILLDAGRTFSATASSAASATTANRRQSG
jgi:hypothetical protein